MRKSIVLIGMFLMVSTIPCLGRFYDPTIGRFLIPDPLAGKYPSISPYVYCLNNPLRNIDPDGKEVRIYSRPVINLPIIGNHRHLFIIVKNENTNTFTSRGLFPKNLIIGAITYREDIKGMTTSVIKKDIPAELGAVKKLEVGEKANVKLETVITPPKGMSEKDFDQAVLNAADNYPVNERPYDSGQGPNSNTYVDDVIETTGGVIPDIPNATQQNWEEDKKEKKDEDKQK